MNDSPQAKSAYNSNTIARIGSDDTLFSNTSFARRLSMPIWFAEGVSVTHVLNLDNFIQATQCHHFSLQLLQMDLMGQKIVTSLIDLLFKFYLLL